MRKNKGITLIALVITIIVLLILAGISVAMLTGENGILTRVIEAKNKTLEAEEKETIKLAITSSKMKEINTLKITKKNLEEAIKEEFGGNKDFLITDNKDGSFLIKMNDTRRIYYVEETGELIEQSKMLKISTSNELKKFRDNVNNGNTYEGWYIYLANDISLDVNEEWNPIGKYLMENSSLTDETNKPFKGIFDGRKYEIDGILINNNDKAQGVFGLVNNAVIKNLSVGEKCNIIAGEDSRNTCRCFLYV